MKEDFSLPPKGRFAAQAAARPQRACARYRDFLIARKTDFDSYPWIINGKSVTTGFEVLSGNANPIPAQAWFLTEADTRRAVDIMQDFRRLEAWWRMAWETNLTAMAGGPLHHRGYTIRQRVVAWGNDQTDCAHTDGFDVFNPVPDNLRLMLPGGRYFQSLPEAIEGINLSIEGNGTSFDGCFWQMVFRADNNRMIGHGACLIARAAEDVKAGEKEAAAEFKIDLEARAADRLPLAAGESGDYRSFIHETWYEGDSVEAEDRRTKVWSVALDMTLTVLEGDSCNLDMVKKLVDAFYQGFEKRQARGESTNVIPSDKDAMGPDFATGAAAWHPEQEEEETPDDDSFVPDESMLSPEPLTLHNRVSRFRKDGQ